MKVNNVKTFRNATEIRNLYKNEQSVHKGMIK